MRYEYPINTRQRDEVFAYTWRDWRDALKLANCIEDHWFRCQALSHVANICTSPKTKVEIIDSAFEVANSISDINRKVSVSAWPLESALLVGLDEFAVLNTSRVLDLLKVEPNPVRQMNACMTLMHKLSSNIVCFTLCFDRFIEQAGKARSWRVPDSIVWIAATIARILPDRLPELRRLLIKPRFIARFDQICAENEDTH